ncbi:Uncharacterised protein [Mycobacteroides abscessus subsp. abscessus]|nr:Uncharacterised protein [Mycobacteroides abscessus subsp. abscessus]
MFPALIDGDEPVRVLLQGAVQPLGELHTSILPFRTVWGADFAELTSNAQCPGTWRRGKRV